MKRVSIALLLLLIPSAASAQATVDRPRIGAYLALGFAGDAEYHTNLPIVGTVTDGLDVTAGGGVRFELPVHDYLVLGGNVELLTFETDARGAEREAVFNTDAWARVRYAFEIADDVYVEPYVGVPFGLSIAVLDDVDGMGDEPWPGFNVGVLGGANLIVANAVALFLEVGWRWHHVFSMSEALGAKPDLTTNQLAMQLGFSVLL